jgi:hypothetical protein
MGVLKNEEDKGGEGDDKPKPLTIEDVQAIVSKTVNRSVTDHIKRALEGDSFTTKMADIVKAALQATKDEDPDGDEPTGGAGDKARGGDGKFAGKLSPEAEARIKAAEKRAEKAEKLALDNEKRAKEAEEKKAWQEERTTLTGALTKAGVRKELMPAAIALLHTEQKRLSRAEDGTLRFKHGDDDHEVDAGIAAFLKTEEGQSYLPPRNAAGSGSTGANRGTGGGTTSGSASDADIGAWLSSPRT